MPEDFYKVGPSNNRHFDELGLRALERDWAAWSSEPSDDVMQRSQFNLLYDIGVHVFERKSKQAVEYAMYFMARCEQIAQKRPSYRRSRRRLRRQTCWQTGVRCGDRPKRIIRCLQQTPLQTKQTFVFQRVNTALSRSVSS